MLVSLAGRHAPVSFQNLCFSGCNCFFPSCQEVILGCKLTHSHQEQQRSVSDIASLSCTASWECSVPSDLATCLLSSVPWLCAPRGCPRPHRVSCFSWRLTVCSHGPVCGCWPCRFHSHHGLLSSWPICSPGSAVLVEGGYGGVPGLEWGLHWPHSSPPQNVLQ